MPLLSDKELGLEKELSFKTVPGKSLLSDDELLGPRVPHYGPDGKPITDDEYRALFTRGSQRSEMSPLGRIGDAAGTAYMHAPTA